LSISEDATDDPERPNRFDDWLPAEFAARGAFTALIVLVAIGESAVTPLASSFLTIIGDETDWDEMAALLSESGRPWDAVAFFPASDDDGGPLDNATARTALAALSARIADDRLVLNEGHFFERQGRRLAIEEVGVH
jgi:hypothetical protein